MSLASRSISGRLPHTRSSNSGQSPPRGKRLLTPPRRKTGGIRGQIALATLNAFRVVSLCTPSGGITLLANLRCESADVVAPWIIGLDHESAHARLLLPMALHWGPHGSQSSGVPLLCPQTLKSGLTEPCGLEATEAPQG
jgi:hypothetical protein